MDPIKTIGQKLTGEVERDCIHIAILPVIADSDWLAAGTKVEFVFGTTDKVVPTSHGRDGIGVVDPFLKDYANKGEKVWVFMTPGSVTGMRHHWAHPAIPEPEDAETMVAKRVANKLKGPAHDAEHWLRRFCQKWHLDYDLTIEAAINKEYFASDGVDTPGRDELGEDYDLLWGNLELVTGRRFYENHRKSVGWSCSC